MLNIISFFTFSILAGKLFSKKAYGKEAVIMAAVCGYMGILDLLNTYSTLLSNGIFLALLSFIIRAVVILCSVNVIQKCNKIAARRNRNVVNVDFRVRGNRYRKAS